MNAEALEAVIRRSLAERDKRRAQHLFRHDVYTAADNALVDQVLAAADTYAAAAAPVSGRRTAGKG
jgi:hypothetical protein